MLASQSTNYTEMSVSSVFICRYSVFLGIANTDVGIGILKYRGINQVAGFGIG